MTIGRGKALTMIYRTSSNITMYYSNLIWRDRGIFLSIRDYLSDTM